MEQKLIEGTGLVSSSIALGTWSMGEWMWGGSDEGEAIKTIRTALELGITLIDTVPAYCDGPSDEIGCVAGSCRNSSAVAASGLRPTL
jgi:aryl-alcohol dehydrogenase-like predicted oxidoreductase